MFVYFTIYKHNPPRRSWNITLKIAFFSIFMGFQNANENVFHGFGNLVIWLWKSIGNVLELCLE